MNDLREKWTPPTIQEAKSHAATATLVCIVSVLLSYAHLMAHQMSILLQNQNNGEWVGSEEWTLLHKLEYLFADEIPYLRCSHYDSSIYIGLTQVLYYR